MMQNLLIALTLHLLVGNGVELAVHQFPSESSLMTVKSQKILYPIIKLNDLSCT
jgi:hypothetical protein